LDLLKTAKAEIIMGHVEMHGLEMYKGYKGEGGY